jgi:hypothetical protein
MTGKTEIVEAKGPNPKKVNQIKLPPRAETIVRVPVVPGSPTVGITSKREMQEGIIVAASLTEVINGYVMTSILNTNDIEVEIQEPVVELD